MYLLEGIIVKQQNGKFMAAILKLSHEFEPGCDTILERELDSMEDASLWVDDELSRLVHNRGIWE